MTRAGLDTLVKIPAARAAASRPVGPGAVHRRRGCEQEPSWSLATKARSPLLLSFYSNTGISRTGSKTGTRTRCGGRKPRGTPAGVRAERNHLPEHRREARALCDRADAEATVEKRRADRFTPSSTHKQVRGHCKLHDTKRPVSRVRDRSCTNHGFGLASPHLQGGLY